MPSPPRLAPPVLNRLRARRARIVWWCHVNLWRTVHRALDLLVAAPALLFLLPLFGVLALAIRLHDGGPALSWQRRMGRDGASFELPRFRCIRVDAGAVRQPLRHTASEGAQAACVTRYADDRMTPIGRLIHPIGIAALPQLWCVLRGRMSLFGPRPPAVGVLGGRAAADRQRLLVTRTLTDHRQTGQRTDPLLPRRVEAVPARKRELSL